MVAQVASRDVELAENETGGASSNNGDYKRIELRGEERLMVAYVSIAFTFCIYAIIYIIIKRIFHIDSYVNYLLTTIPFLNIVLWIFLNRKYKDNLRKWKKIKDLLLQIPNTVEKTKAAELNSKKSLLTKSRIVDYFGVFTAIIGLLFLIIIVDFSSNLFWIYTIVIYVLSLVLLLYIVFVKV